MWRPTEDAALRNIELEAKMQRRANRLTPLDWKIHKAERDMARAKTNPHDPRNILTRIDRVAKEFKMPSAVVAERLLLIEDYFRLEARRGRRE